MACSISCIASGLTRRFGGPMSFRLILQPAMATFFAIRDGIKDARLGRPPLWRVLLHGDQA